MTHSSPSSSIQSAWSAFVNRCIGRVGQSQSELARQWGVGESVIRTWAAVDCRIRISVPKLETLIEILPRMSIEDRIDLAGWLFGDSLSITPASEAESFAGGTILLALDRAINAIGGLNDMARQLLAAQLTGGIGAEAGVRLAAEGATARRNLDTALAIIQHIARRRAS